MQISDFANLIREIPYEYQSFDIKKSNWEKSVNQKWIIDEIFSNEDIISISRSDLFQCWRIQEFVIRVLMWGYPTKGRGNNIENILIQKNFDKLIYLIKTIEGKNHLTSDDILEFLKIKGLGMSTITKFLYFKKVRIGMIPALIFDQKVINALNSGRYSDFGIERFRNIRINNSIDAYLEYLNFMNKQANLIDVLPDQLELFLYEFGVNLKEPKGEEGDWDLMK